MTQVVTPTQTAKFYYDGDGQMIMKEIGSVKTVYIGGYFEYTQDGATAGTRKYYAFGSKRVAMQSNEEPVKFLFSDHLGSNTLILDSRTTSEIRDEARYKPYGDLRYQLASSGPTLPTDLLYTGQRRIAEIGLYYYNARWVDVDTAHFTQPDTIVPNPLNAYDWDRFQYVRANPLIYNDPSGHFANILIGAGIGAAANVGLYLWNEIGNQDGFSWQEDYGDLLIAAGQGALVGGLIGSGVGAGAGVSFAMSAGLGAASNLVGDQVGNLITGEDYNATTTSIDAVMGGISQGITMYTPGMAGNLVAGGYKLLIMELIRW